MKIRANLMLITMPIALALGAPACTDDGSDDPTTVTPIALTGSVTPVVYQCTGGTCHYALGVSGDTQTCFLAGLKGELAYTNVEVDVHTDRKYYIDVTSPPSTLITVTAECVAVPRADRVVGSYASASDPFPVPIAAIGGGRRCFLSKLDILDTASFTQSSDEVAISSLGSNWTLGGTFSVGDDWTAEAVCIEPVTHQSSGSTTTSGQIDDTTSVGGGVACGLTALGGEMTRYTAGSELEYHGPYDDWTVSMGPSSSISFDCVY